MQPLYLARIEEVISFRSIAPPAITSLLRPDFLVRLGLSPQAKVLDLNLTRR